MGQSAVGVHRVRHDLQGFVVVARLGQERSEVGAPEGELEFVGGIGPGQLSGELHGPAQCARGLVVVAQVAEEVGEEL
jgi:hypothetical protein